jgi:hypothetical protein
MTNFQRLSPDMIKKNIATGDISEVKKKKNSVQYKEQPDLVQNNFVTVDNLKK